MGNAFYLSSLDTWSRAASIRQTVALATSGIAALVALWPASAVAQSGASSVTAEPANVSEEIVVTGYYRFLDDDTSGTTNLPLPLEEVPQSISLVSNDFIEAADLKIMGEIAQYTPGAFFAREEPAYGSGIKLRGFRASYAIDGLPIGDFLAEPDTVTVDRLEIVKGPSSVVYGAATPGGLINLVLKGASPDTPSYVSVLGGSWDRWRLEGQVAGALNDSGTIRGIGIGTQEEANSFIDFVNMSKSVAYGGLDFDLGDSLSAYARASYERLRRTAYDGVLAFSDGSLPPIGRSFFIGNEDVDMIVKTPRLNAGLSWEISPAWSFDLTAIYQELTRDGGNAYVYGLDPNGDMNTLAEQFIDWKVRDRSIAASSVLKLDGMGLANSFISTSIRYQDYRYTFSNIFAVGTVNLFDGEDAIRDHMRELYISAGTGSFRDQRLSYLTASAQAVVQVAERVTLLGGLSYSDPTIESRFVDSGPWQNFNPGGQTSYRGALTVEPIQGLNIYASYSESFQPQNRIDINDNVLPPLSGTQYELGTKYRLPGRALLLTASVFELTQANQQVFDTFGPDGQDRYKALGEVRHRGLELQAIGRITDQWQLNAGLTLLDPKLTKDADRSLVGERRAWLPDKSSSLYTSYDFNGGISVAGGARFVDSVKTSTDGSTRDLPSHTLFDASVGYAFESWWLQVNMKNISDKPYYVGTWETLFYGLMPGEPRSITVSLKKEF